MVAYSFAKRLTPNLALALAGGAGAIAALAVLLAPGSLFENAVVISGAPAFVPAAEPPLGLTARICLASAAGLGIALLSWGMLSLLTGVAVPRLGGIKRKSTVRRADAHPDAPPREPLRAGRDLGFEAFDQAAVVKAKPVDLDLPPDPVIEMGAPAPAAKALALDIPADPPPPPPVQPLPADLDQPLSAFDPAALPEVPMPAPRPVAPLVQMPQPPVYAEGERFEAFDLSPPPVAQPQPATPPITGADTVATVHSLLDRLERGIARRVQPAEAKPAPEPVPQGLETTLDVLRRMAVRA